MAEVTDHDREICGRVQHELIAGRLLSANAAIAAYRALTESATRAKVEAECAQRTVEAVEAARRDERTKVLHEIREAAKPGYSQWPASDAEILEHVREVVETLEKP